MKKLSVHSKPASQLRMLATLSLLIMCGAGISMAQSPRDPLKSGFENPPASARPRVWWHWMNGNITQEGIRLDLEWMHRSGLAGIQTFDAALATPQVVDKRLVYMSPEWKDAFRYSLKLAGQLGMEQTIASSAGWSETGGPWVPPAQGMKKYVWSETILHGGQSFHGELPHPPSTTGAFQGLGIVDTLAAPAGAQAKPQFYADSVVIAFRRPAINAMADHVQAQIRTQAGPVDAGILSDGDLLKTLPVAVAKDDDGTWISYDFEQPQRIASLTIVMKDFDVVTALMSHVSNPQKILQSSDDGVRYHDVVMIADGGAPQHTISFPAVTSRHFRLLLRRGKPPEVPAWLSGMDLSSMGMTAAAPAANYQIAEFALHPEIRVNRFEEKAGFALVPDLYEFATPVAAKAECVSTAEVVNLTSKMSADGILDWTPPAGDWVVLRLGYSLLGITNHPATAEATGLEVDKLNHNYVRNYMTAYLDSFKDTVGADMLGKPGIQYMVTDSWEAGSQNWTDTMIGDFHRLRGYDPTPWLPVLTGQIIESSAASDRFLWDFRKTIGDLIATEHYGQVQASLKERGMGHYGESHEYGRAFVGDGMEVKKLNDIPMSAMWVQAPGVNEENYNYNADDRESASVAHIYGQNVAAAESLTAASSPWAWAPETLKPTADQELLNGINRFVIHESAHQPLVGKAPGLTLGPFGQWFNRNETWAEQARPWIDYIARSSYMLQQGRFAADLLYFYGEDSNLTAIFQFKAPPVPVGHGFDYINADALIHELKVNQGQITTSSGMSYQILALDPYSRHMSLPVLRAIRALVNDGATVTGSKPTDDPSQADDQAEFHRLADELFGNGSGEQHIGKGKVYATGDLNQVLSQAGVAPDFTTNNSVTDKQVPFVHRKLIDGDVYFVDNRSGHDLKIDASFRIVGKAPEFWRAENGTAEHASYSIASGRTVVPLQLEPWGAVFVVFRDPARKVSNTVPVTVTSQLTVVPGPWELAFQSGRGAPPTVSLETLQPWNESRDTGIKYFSGTGNYTTTITAVAGWWKPHQRIFLDLGSVKNLAEVSLNGKPVGVVWHPPFRLDITDAVRPGPNELSVKVTNAWVNRLVGDEQPEEKMKYTFTDVKPYKAASPLLPSGLLGPVSIDSVGPHE